MNIPKKAEEKNREEEYIRAMGYYLPEEKTYSYFTVFMH